MFHKLLLLAALLFQMQISEAIVENNIFTLEKSYHTQNVMKISTYTDEHCNFISSDNSYLNFYWLMDGVIRKKIHPLIRHRVQERIKFEGINSEKNSFKIRLQDLTELKHDLKEIVVVVSSVMEKNVCQIKSIIKLGASENYRLLNIKHTFCEVSINFLGIPNGCKFLELVGVDANTGDKIRIRFNTNRT